MEKKSTRDLTIAKVCLLFLSISILIVGGRFATKASAKTGNIVLNKSSVTMYVGGKDTIKVKRVSPKKLGKAVTYKSDKKGIVVVNNKGVLTARKEGTAKITVSLKSDKSVKKIVKVRVKAKSDSTSQKDSQGSDVASLKKIIKEQKAKSKAANVLLNDNIKGKNYTWKNGRLTGITWESAGLEGKLDLTAFTELTSLSVYSNLALTELDISTCTKLTKLDISATSIKSMDFTKFPNLTTLICHLTDLKSINLTKCTKLLELSCHSIPAKKIDLRKCPLLFSDKGRCDVEPDKIIK